MITKSPLTCSITSYAAGYFRLHAFDNLRDASQWKRIAELTDRLRQGESNGAFPLSFDTLGR